jgi:acyl-CoA thioesterase
MDIKEFINNDKFASLLGIELLEAGEGRAKAKLEIRDEHLNSINIAHGGAIFSLADLAFAAASNSYGNIAVAINANISFLKAMGKGILYAEASEISKNRKLATYNIIIRNAGDEIIASFQGTVYRKEKMLIEDQSFGR